jgi:hypothetical protein
MSERDALGAEVARLRAEVETLSRSSAFAPPGHFYSPIPSLEDVERDAARLFEEVPREIPGVDLQEDQQLALLQSFVRYYDEMPFKAGKVDGLRYYFENPAYSYSDGICLHGMIRHLEPRRIIEVGSGYSSCMTLDTCERFLGGDVSVTFIEPYPALLQSLLTAEDLAKVRIIPTRLQDVDLCEFDALQANDILFIDSTHVSKIGSDVNRVLFEVLPRLASGVHVHVHDIFHPFEYPKYWFLEGRAWNETYLLRAFLQYNAAFQVVLMNTFMERYHEAFFEEHMPLCLKNPGGSIWLRRI